MWIPKWRLEIRTSRSGGAGGQHVNKTESKVELRFHVDSADWIPDPVRNRFKIQNANRMNKEGEFILSSETFRSQTRNLDDAMNRLSELLEKAAIPPKKRIKTKVTKSAKRKRLDNKKRHGLIKKTRRSVKGEE